MRRRMAPENLISREYDPPSRLRGAVEGFVVHEELHTTGSEEHRLLPSADIVLSFYEGNSWTEGADGRLTPLPKVFVMGPRLTSTRLVSRGLTRIIGFKLHSWCADALLDLTAVRGFHTDVNAALAALSERVGPRLRAGASESALDVVSGWLLARCERAREAPGPAEAARLELHVTSGRARIATLAASLGLSVRQLERRFKDAAGLSPKALARLIRFSRASERLEREPETNLAELASNLGYADQAHFIREFRSFSGTSPGRFAASASVSASVSASRRRRSEPPRAAFTK